MTQTPSRNVSHRRNDPARGFLPATSFWGASARAGRSGDFWTMNIFSLPALHDRREPQLLYRRLRLGSGSVFFRLKRCRGRSDIPCISHGLVIGGDSCYPLLVRGEVFSVMA